MVSADLVASGVGRGGLRKRWGGSGRGGLASSHLQAVSGLMCVRSSVGVVCGVLMGHGCTWYHSLLLV